MDKTPVEILDRVFQLACTDDGSTGRSLSAVSSRIRTISARHKYYSLHVCGAKRIAKFASFLRNSHAAVQYLKLDCTTPSVEPGGLLTATSDFQSAVGRDTDREIDRICAHVYIISYLLTSTLKGFYLIPAAVPLALTSFSFPHLDTFFLYDSLYNIFITWDSSHFPALKRLDISCDASTEYGHTSAFFGLDLPALTHFGCCAHGQEYGIWNLLELFAQSGKHGGAMSLAESPGFNIFLTCDMLRIGAFCSDLPQLLAKIEDLKLIGEFPSITARKHDRTLEDTMHVLEWRYVVEGGEGFLAFLS